MRPTISTAVLLILSAFVLSGATCQPVVINDAEICGDKGELGASCFHLLTDESRKLTFEEWEEQRFGQLCMQAESWANIKASLMKLCVQTKRCSWEQIKEIKNLGKNLEGFEAELYD